MGIKQGNWTQTISTTGKIQDKYVPASRSESSSAVENHMCDPAVDGHHDMG